MFFKGCIILSFKNAHCSLSICNTIKVYWLNRNQEETNNIQYMDSTIFATFYKYKEVRILYAPFVGHWLSDCCWEIILAVGMYFSGHGVTLPTTQLVPNKWFIVHQSRTQLASSATSTFTHRLTMHVQTNSGSGPMLHYPLPYMYKVRG